MAPNPFFSGRVPKDLHNRIEQYLAETGQSKTQLLINALSSYLNYSIQASAITGNPSEDKFSSLEARVEALEKLIAGRIDSNQLSDQAGLDNTLDNTLDNEKMQEQLSLKEVDNIADNKPDNLVSQEARQLESTTEKFSEESYDHIGKYHIPEILEFEEFQPQDKKKIKNKLRNANTTKDKTVLIPPYFFRINGKEPGAKGQLIYNTYRMKD